MSPPCRGGGLASLNDLTGYSGGNFMFLVGVTGNYMFVIGPTGNFMFLEVLTKTDRP
jgi:hypothetical protein